MSQTIVFIRNDDVGEMTDPLRRFIEVTLELGVPCNHQVVPGYLDDGTAVELKRLKQAHPDVIHWNQHGVTHERLEGGVVDYAEFAGGRPYEVQYQELLRGRDDLARRLGDAFSADVFTPPCHKYDAQTLRALGDLGFRTLSAGVRVDPMSRLYYAVGRASRRIDLLGKRVSYHGGRTPDARMSEVSVAIDVHEDQDASGQRIDKTADALWHEFEAVRQKLRVVGVMTHHQACETKQKQDAFRDFVRRMLEAPDVRFMPLHEIVA